MLDFWKAVTPAIFGILGTILGGYISYSSTRVLAREEKTAEIRSSAYIEFANESAKFWSPAGKGRSEADIAAYNKARVKMALFADEDAVKSLADITAETGMRPCVGKQIPAIDFWRTVRQHVIRTADETDVRPAIAILTLSCVFPRSPGKP